MIFCYSQCSLQISSPESYRVNMFYIIKAILKFVTLKRVVRKMPQNVLDNTIIRGVVVSTLGSSTVVPTSIR